MESTRKRNDKISRDALALQKKILGFSGHCKHFRPFSADVTQLQTK